MYYTRIGHVKLRVHDLDRSVNFYTRFLSLRLVERVDNLGFAFLSGGEAHHEIALEGTGKELSHASSNATGVEHIAFQVPGKKSFARAYKTLTEAGIRVNAVDNAISWSMYFEDPDGNGLEIYCDMRHDPDGQTLWQGWRQPLDGARVLRVLEEEEQYDGPPPGQP